MSSFFHFGDLIRVKMLKSFEKFRMRGEIMQKWLTFESFSFFREIGTFQRFRDRYEMLRAKVPTRCKQKQKRNESQTQNEFLQKEDISTKFQS